MAEDVLMDMVDEEDGLLINRMQLHGISVSVLQQMNNSCIIVVSSAWNTRMSLVIHTSNFLRSGK